MVAILLPVRKTATSKGRQMAALSLDADQLGVAQRAAATVRDLGTVAMIKVVTCPVAVDTLRLDHAPHFVIPIMHLLAQLPADVTIKYVTNALPVIAIISHLPMGPVFQAAGRPLASVIQKTSPIALNVTRMGSLYLMTQIAMSALLPMSTAVVASRSRKHAAILAKN